MVEDLGWVCGAPGVVEELGWVFGELERLGRLRRVGPIHDWVVGSLVYDFVELMIEVAVKGEGCREVCDAGGGADLYSGGWVHGERAEGAVAVWRGGFWAACALGPWPNAPGP